MEQGHMAALMASEWRNLPLTLTSSCRSIIMNLLTSHIRAQSSQLTLHPSLTALSEDLALPIFVGEYGVIRNANTDGVGRDKLVDETERGEWTQFIKSQVESHNFAGCYFDYATGFAATEPETKRWIPQILNALIEFPRQLHYSPYVPYINPF